MKLLKIAVTIIAALTLASCAKDVEMGAGVAGNGNACINDDGVVKGWVRIKLQPAAHPLRVGAVTRGESIMSGNVEIDKLAAELGAVEVRRVFPDGGRFSERRRKFGLHLWYDLRFEEELPVSRAKSKFENVEGIACVEPIYKVVFFDEGPGLPGELVYTPAENIFVRPSEMPFNDPQLSLQWHYNNDGTMTNSDVGADANIFEAWKKVTGNPNVIVAIIDGGGIDFNHPDLAANMWINEAELNGQTGVDDDGNGYVDDIYGFNGVTKDGNFVPASHATHVAGTVAAVNNNGIGVGGVAGGDGTPNSGVKLMSCQIMGGQSAKDFSPYSQSFIYAADNGALIAQCSWGFKPEAVGELPQDVSDAMDYFRINAGCDESGKQIGLMKGGVMIFAVGNDGSRYIAIPADDPRTIAVTAMAPDFTPGTYSNYGVEADIFAPGGADPEVKPYITANKVYSTDLDNTYSYKHGTSMACPHVSGVAALIISYFGKQGFTTDDLKQRLLNAVKPLDPKYVDSKHFNELGVGMLDAGMIFLENSNQKPAVPTQPQATVKEKTLTISWLVPVDGNELPVTKFEVSYKSESLGKFIGVYPAGIGKQTYTNVTTVGERASFPLVGMYNTKYDFEVIAIDRYGNRSESPVKFSFSVGDYTNQKPKVTNRFNPVVIEDSGETNKVTFNLADYFADANLADGDILKYTTVSRNETAVKTSIENGNQLVITPLSKGESNVSVTATDIDGQQALASLIVTVKNGVVVPPVETEVSLSLNPSPANDILNASAKGWANVSAAASVYDSASRKVMEMNTTFDANEKATFEVAKLAPGTYTLVLKGNGKQLSSAFVKR